MIAAALTASNFDGQILQVGSVSGVIQSSRSSATWDGPRLRRLDVVAEILTELGPKTIVLSPRTDVIVHRTAPIAA